MRPAVESVLDYGSKKLPPGLEWDELPKYFHAVVAASSVQADWALAHEKLWRCVWPSELVKWSPASLDEQSTGEFDAHVSIDKCWSEEWLWRCFTRRPRDSTTRRRGKSPDILYLGVSITLDGASVGVSIEPCPTAAGPDATLLYFDHESTSWRSVEQSITGPTLDLSALQHAARQALHWLDESSRGEI